MPRKINATAFAPLALLVAGPAQAQTSASQPAASAIGIAPPKPAPLPGATPVPTPDAPRVALPRQRAVPRAKPLPKPSPSATPTAKPTDTTNAKVVSPPVESLPVAEPEALPTIPAPPVAPAAEPTPLPNQDVAPPPPRDASSAIWPWLVGLAVAVAAVAFALLRRRRPAPLAITRETASDLEGMGATPEAAQVPRPAAPASPAPQMLERARPPAAPTPSAGLTIALRPIRAGLNLLTATADCEVTVTNTGDTAAEDMRCDLRLLSTHAGQDDDLAAAFAVPGGRPIASAFTLGPAETRTIRGMAVLSRDAIRALNAGGRMMFVPLVAVNLGYRVGGEPRQITQAFALGIERVDSAKLAPFWLDGPARMHDAVAARPHAPIER